MERNGFECQYKEKGMFTRLRKIPDSINFYEKYFEGVNYIFCTHTRGFMVYEKWIVAVFHENNRVTNVAVNYGLIGL
ncbi:MAG TPA: hypothetical protein VK184_21535 [Nostocaceae cyanobacterium]|nr:hypothetical protein [Nostocaceae cyanobacterium]